MMLMYIIIIYMMNLHQIVGLSILTSLRYPLIDFTLMLIFIPTVSVYKCIFIFIYLNKDRILFLIINCLSKIIMLLSLIEKKILIQYKFFKKNIYKYITIDETICVLSSQSISFVGNILL